MNRGNKKAGPKGPALKHTRLKLSHYCKQFHFKEKIRPGRNASSGSTIAVGKLGGEDKYSFLPYLHLGNHYIPAPNELTYTDRKFCGASLLAGVEHIAIEKGAGIMNPYGLAGGWGTTVSRGHNLVSNSVFIDNPFGNYFRCSGKVVCGQLFLVLFLTFSGPLDFLIKQFLGDNKALGGGTLSKNSQGINLVPLGNSIYYILPLDYLSKNRVFII
jgi:hypothetical protein